MNQLKMTGGCSTVKNDLSDFQIEYSFNEIQEMGQTQFKDFVKAKLAAKALEFLNCKKKDMSKMSNLNYSDLQLQTYLSENSISTRHKKLLFKLRTRMLRVGHNYGNKCPCPMTGCSEPDQQQHVAQCDIIQRACPDIANTVWTVWTYMEMIQKK